MLGWQKKITIIVLASSLVACQAIGPEYERPEMKVPEGYTEDVLNQPQSMQPVTNTWWHLFNDATLDGLIEQALINNTELKLATARIEEADAYAREVGAASLPTVDGDSSASRSRVTGSGPFPVFADNPRNNFQFQLGAQYEIDFWGKVASAKAAARATLLSTRYAKDTVALSLASRVAEQYVNLRSIESQKIIVKDSVRSREESLRLTMRRLEGGISSALDVHQAEVAVANLKAQTIDFDRQRAIALHQLATLTGKLDLILDAGDQLALPIPPVPPAGLPSSLMENRPDIRQAEALLIAQHANIRNAKSALYPSISLTGALGGQSLALSDILKAASRIWTGGININLPIFNAGKLDAKVDQATAQQKQALIQYEASVQSAFREVNDALVNLRQFAMQSSAYQEGVVAAKKVVNISENRYETGYSTYLEVLDSQRVYNDAALNAIASRQSQLLASVSLFRALGGGWDGSDSPAVDQQ